MKEIVREIEEELLRLLDEKYRDFQGGLIPTVDRERFLGVRTPDLRKMARILSKRDDIGDFLLDLPHRYFDEDQLHAFLLSEIRDFDRCMREVETFLPYVNNWATCDQLSPKAFAKRADSLLPYIERWLTSENPFTVRFGIGMLMRYFLEERFRPSYLERVAAIRSEEYYVNMMIAWYFATALAKQYDATVSFLEEGRLSPFVHGMTIRKAIDSYRISPKRKSYLRTLRREGKEESQ